MVWDFPVMEGLLYDVKYKYKYKCVASMNADWYDYNTSRFKHSVLLNFSYHLLIFSIRTQTVEPKQRKHTRHSLSL